MTWFVVFKHLEDSALSVLPSQKLDAKNWNKIRKKTQVVDWNGLIYNLKAQTSKVTREIGLWQITKYKMHFDGPADISYIHEASSGAFLTHTASREFPCSSNHLHTRFNNHTWQPVGVQAGQLLHRWWFQRYHPDSRRTRPTEFGWTPHPRQRRPE